MIFIAMDLELKDIRNYMHIQKRGMEGLIHFLFEGTELMLAKSLTKRKL